MTVTYRPTDAAYVDEADVRHELTRVFDVCNGCRRCTELCSSFPTLFGMLDRLDVADAGSLTPFQQDVVVDGCFQCGRCATGCPYTPELHELRLDFPRLMLRAAAMRYASGQTSLRRRTATHVIGHTDLVGGVATAFAPVANAVIRRRGGSTLRRVLAAVTGVSAVRRLPAFSRQRFSGWLARRPTPAATPRGRVTVFPTCLVDYQSTGIGKDFVRVLERNGIACSSTRARCCGAPWLHAGDRKRFAAVARRNVEILADEIGRGGDVVVLQPTCALTITRDYLDSVGGPAAQLVARHVHGATGYLMELHAADGPGLDTGFTGEVPESITYQATFPSIPGAGQTGRDLVALTGAGIEVVEQSSGVHSPLGLRADNDETSQASARKLADGITAAGGGRPGNAVVGECILANTAVVEQTGIVPIHPIELIARAYGIPADD